MVTNSQVAGHEIQTQSLLPAFGARQIFAAREYWSWRCAVCDAPSHSIEHVPWQPPYSLNWPGIVPTNMLPLCDICADSKGDSEPETWLTHKLGQKRADGKLAQIKIYFREMADDKAVDFWYEIGLRRAIRRYLRSVTDRQSLQIEFAPGEDDDVALWLHSLDHSQQQSTIKAALRAYMKNEDFDPLHYLESVLTRTANEGRHLAGEMGEE
jgi:hypothetical protein